nr:glycosyltransferase family 4 protein [Hyphomonas sp. Mor2]
MLNRSTPNQNQPLNVLEMGTQFGVGGITRHILTLSDWLKSRGHTIAFAGTSDAWTPKVEDPSLYLDIPTRFVAGEGGGLPARLGHVAKASLKLRSWLAKHPVDLIHAHESAPALVALAARVGRNIPIAVTYHGSEPDRIAAFGAIAKRCDLVITPSYASGEDLVKIGGVPREKLKVIGLGVTPAPQDPDEEVAALRQELLGDGTHLIVTVARLLEQKGIDILIDCVARLKDTHPGYRFVLAGDGPDEDALKALAREKGVDTHLSFIGRTSRPHLHLKAADIFLLTSRWEALPFTIVEAFQVGTPSVATACSGVVELIDDEVGAVVPIGDVPAICDAVIRVLSDDQRLKTMGETALARSREDRFDPDWVHNVFEQTYFDLARRKSRL